jgi:hypothetical protein
MRKIEKLDMIKERRVGTVGRKGGRDDGRQVGKKEENVNVMKEERRKEGKMDVMKGGKEEDRKVEHDEGEENNRSRCSRKERWTR